jgi:gliding motility-associated lipoprotein GldH
MSINKILYIFFCFFFLIFTSCDSHKIADSYQNIPENAWHINRSVAFEFNISESTDKIDFLIGLRNNNEYRYSNIFFFVDLMFPDGSLERDTVQFLLAEPNGKWLGEGIGPIKHLILTYKENQETQSGTYKFNISHGMRDSILLGIEDIGFRIEKSK